MTRYLLTLMLFGLPLLSLAQGPSVASFRVLDNDLDARINHPKRDQNGDPSAIIKVVTTQTGFTFDVGSLGVVATVQKPGEIWVYVPSGVQRITINHPQLGVLRNYALPIPIKAATVYEMVLTTGRVTTIVEEQIATEFIVITSEPSGADVFINDLRVGSTPFNDDFEYGVHNFRVELPLYHPEAGRIELTREGKVQRHFALRPNFGYIQVNTRPESGATVTIGGEPLASTSPVKSHRLRSGVHTVTVSKPLFHSATQQVTLGGGQTSEVTLDMRPAFGSIRIETTPESGAEVLRDGQPTGLKTPATLERLPSRSYDITVRLADYQPHTERVVVTDGANIIRTINLQPTFGFVSVTAEGNAAIYIDNVFRANGAWEGRLPAGVRTIEARREKHHTDSRTLAVSVGERYTLSLHPRARRGNIRITSDPFDADIAIDGQSVNNKTPHTIRDMLIGEYKITLSKTGFMSETRAVTIEEGKTENLTINLGTGMPINITSTPSGAEVWVDGSPLGKTPLTATLKLGERSVKLVHGTRIVEETIKVVQGGRARFEFNVVDGMDVTIVSNPSGAQLFVNDKLVGHTPYTSRLSIGNHRLKLVNGSHTHEETIAVEIGGKSSHSFDIRIPFEKNITSTPSNARVYIAGEYKGNTPLTLKIIPGVYRVKFFVSDKHDDREQLVTFKGYVENLHFTILPNQDELQGRQSRSDYIHGKNFLSEGLFSFALNSQGDSKGRISGKVWGGYYNSFLAVAFPLFLKQGFGVNDRTGLHTLYLGYSFFGEMVVSTDMLVMDFISLYLGYIASSPSLKSRFRFEAMGGIRFQHISNPDLLTYRGQPIDRIREFSVDSETGEGTSFGQMLLSELRFSYERFLWRRAYLVTTLGIAFGSEMDWYYQSDIDAWEQNPVSQPTPIRSANLPRTPYVEGLRPFLGIGLRLY